MRFSIVVAVYNHRYGLFELDERIHRSMQSMDESNYEVIYVEDRSSDVETWAILKKMAISNDKNKLIRMARNFGQHPAIEAGMLYSSGEYVVLMDCDLQDEPENIPLLYEKLKKEDVHIVYAQRQDRKDSKNKKLGSILFYWLLSYLTGAEFDSSIGTFRIMERKVVDTYLGLPENRKFVSSLFTWMGFSYSTLAVIHGERKEGKSNYSVRKLLKLARSGIIGSSTRLLNLGIYLGLIMAGLAVAAGVFYFIKKIFFSVPVPGYISIILSVLFIGSTNLIVLGIIGEYLSEIFWQLKRRPDFIIDETINFNNEP